MTTMYNYKASWPFGDCSDQQAEQKEAKKKGRKRKTQVPTSDKRWCFKISGVYDWENHPSIFQLIFPSKRRKEKPPKGKILEVPKAMQKSKAVPKLSASWRVSRKVVKRVTNFMGRGRCSWTLVTGEGFLVGTGEGWIISKRCIYIYYIVLLLSLGDVWYGLLL